MGRSALHSLSRVFDVERHHGLDHRVMRAGQLQLLQQLGITQGQHRLGLVDDVAELLGAQQRHGRHRHQPGFHHRQPDQCQPDRISTAQQDPVAGHQSEVLHQHQGDPVDPVQRLRISQRQRVRAQHRAVCEAFVRGLVKQFLDRIERLRKLQLGRVKQQFGHLRGRWQPLVHKTIHLGRVAHG